MTFAHYARCTLLAVFMGLLQSPANAQFPDLLKSLGGIGGAKPSAPKSSAGATEKNENSKAGGLGGLLGIVGGSQDSDEEIRSGEGVAGIVLGAAKLWNNPKAQKYVNLVGHYIAQQGERKTLPWAFGIVETSSINAFATPGGIILLTSGLYALLETEDELAAVLAHEISHINRQHHYNVVKQQKLVEFGANFAQKQLSQEQNNAMAERLIGMGAELIARGLDKEAEFEADRDGMVLAARAGYDASAILVVLEKLQRRLAVEGDIQLMFKTHPAPVDRIQRLTDAANPALEAAALSSPALRRIGLDGR